MGLISGGMDYICDHVFAKGNRDKEESGDLVWIWFDVNYICFYTVQFLMSVYFKWEK